MKDELKTIIYCGTCKHDFSNAGPCNGSNAEMFIKCFFHGTKKYPFPVISHLRKYTHSLWEPMYPEDFDMPCEFQELPIPKLSEIINQ